MKLRLSSLMYIILVSAVLWVGIPCMANAAARPALGSGVVDLNDQFRPVAGKWNYDDDSVSVCGRIYDGYGCPFTVWEDTSFATFDIRGWDEFSAIAGVSDRNGEASGQVSIEVDGDQQFKPLKKRAGEKGELIKISLTGHQTLTIRATGSIIFAEPKLTRGRGTSSATKIGPSGATAVTSPFVVDPDDIDKLAASLRKQVDSDSTARSRVADGRVAVSTFQLIDIASQSVARNVAEDLYTAMIKCRFQLVERGQLDNVLGELKIQSTALIDPKTAQKIGQQSGCNVILLGSISDRGDRVVINARLMETATGKSIAAERVEMHKRSLRDGEVVYDPKDKEKDNRIGDFLEDYLRSKIAPDGSGPR